MSVPTPVTSSTNNADNGSNRYAMSTWNGPDEIQVNNVPATDRSPSGRPSSCTNATRPMPNDTADATVPTR
jgi:hypothetical protein